MEYISCWYNEFILYCCGVIFGEQPPRTHSIEAPVEIAAKHIEIPEIVEESTELTLYASGTRYPGNYEPLDEVDYLDALSKAEKVVAWAQNICLQNYEER